MTFRLLPLLLLLALPARAQFEGAPAEVEGNADQTGTVDQEKLLQETTEKLKDPAVAGSLAGRLNRSKIADRISGNTDPDQRRLDILAWIEKDPRTAAGMAIGLANDDAQGTHEFEDAVAQRVHTKLEFNPNANKGIFGRLNKSAKDSRLLKKQQDEDMSDEEKRETLKSMFEGQGGQSGKIVTQQFDQQGGKNTPGAVGATGGGLASSYYNRLSAGNLKGYSPQLQAMQSALNLRRPPGAPKLIESGKLDYETLSYPAYGMKFDLENLEKRLRYSQNLALARLLGMDGVKESDLLDPAFEQKLKAKAAGKTLPPGFARAQEALERARQALAQFLQAAQAAKDPNQISKQLLAALGSFQKEAARWITVASLEEELTRLEPSVNFLTPELVATINSCPIDDDVRTRYLHRAESYEGAIRKLKQDDEAAIAALRADDWLSRADAVDATLAQASGLRKDLARNVDDLTATAWRFSRSADQRPSWRRAVDGYVERLLPSSSYAQALRRDRRARDLLRDVFSKIADGQADAAHTVMASYEPPTGGR